MPRFKQSVLDSTTRDSKRKLYFYQSIAILQESFATIKKEYNEYNSMRGKLL